MRDGHGWPLPDDVLLKVFDHLEVQDVGRLASVDKQTSQKIQEIGYPNLLSRSSLYHKTLHPPAPQWPTLPLLQHNTRTLRNLCSHRVLARQIGPTWQRPCMPVLSLAPDNVVVGAGCEILVHSLQPNRKKGGKVISSIQRVQITPNPTSLDDVTGIVHLPSPNQIIISNVRGQLQRLSLPSPSSAASPARITARYTHPPGDAIQSLSLSSLILLSTSRSGLLSLHSTSSPWVPPTTTTLPARTWASHLSLSPSNPFCAVGVSSAEPLQILDITPTGFHPSSTRSLPTSAKSAVYAITQPQENMSIPYSNSPTSLLLSAWFDGHARIHDLRLPAASPAVMSFSDPWSHSPLYSVGFVGNGQVVAGSGRHGLLHFWDPRMSPSQSTVEGSTSKGGQNGWSVYTPGRPESPIYDLQTEGARVWGVTDRRSFVFDFSVSSSDSSDWASLVPSHLRPRVERWGGGGRGGKGWGRKGGEREGLKDYASGYEHAGGGVRGFDSLGAGE